LIAGKARHGKDTVAQMLKDKLLGKSLIIAYADYVKYTAQKYLGWDGIKNEAGREILQLWGTDIVRTKKGKTDFWVDAVSNLIEVLDDEYDHFLIPDCRFPNEILNMKIKYGLDKVIALRIERANFTSELTLEQQNHKSEIGLDDFYFDYCINNDGSLDDLEIEVEKFIFWKVK
jgi:hypothetical protein